MLSGGFTPGPWKIYRASNGKLLGIGDADAGGVTDYQGGFWREGKEMRANINLVAAAPEMFEALAGLVNTYAAFAVAILGSSEEELAEHLSQANAALRKARGEQVPQADAQPSQPLSPTKDNSNG